MKTEKTYSTTVTLKDCEYAVFLSATEITERNDDNELVNYIDQDTVLIQEVNNLSPVPKYFTKELIENLKMAIDYSLLWMDENDTETDPVTEYYAA